MSANSVESCLALKSIVCGHDIESSVPFLGWKSLYPARGWPLCKEYLRDIVLMVGRNVACS